MPEVERKLRLRSCVNVRELGGYPTADGTTRPHRFLRCGGTASLTEDDLAYLRDYGVRRVIDLRGVGESPAITCRFCRQPWVEWINVPLYDTDISAGSAMPAVDVDNYLVSSYLHMLRAHAALRRVFEFCAEASGDECVLFHCAAGMDRTGMLSMLLLGLAGVSRERVIADYCYSFGTVDEVDAVVAARLAGEASPAGPEPFAFYLLRVRLEAIEIVYDTLVREHGSVRAFLQSCGIANSTLDAVRAHLL